VHCAASKLLDICGAMLTRTASMIFIVARRGPPVASRVVLPQEGVGEAADCRQPHGTDYEAQPRGCPVRLLAQVQQESSLRTRVAEYEPVRSACWRSPPFMTALASSTASFRVHS